MLKNLDRLLRDKGISKKDYAEFLGVAEKTVQNKIQGKTDFSYAETCKTKKMLFPEYDLLYIFEDDQAG